MIKLNKESKKINFSAFELRRRRTNWKLVTQDKVKLKIDDFCKAARNSSYPFTMSCRVHDNTINEATVQLTSGPNKTGIFERTDNKKRRNLKSEVEKGSALVFSFASNGTVAILIYPYKSERYKTKESNIIIDHNLSPDEITDKVIERSIIKFLFYIRTSSVYGWHSLSIIDFYRSSIMIAKDIRNRRRVYFTIFSFIIEWSKLLFAGVIGYIVAILPKI